MTARTSPCAPESSWLWQAAGDLWGLSPSAPESSWLRQAAGDLWGALGLLVLFDDTSQPPQMKPIQVAEEDLWLGEVLGLLMAACRSQA